MTVYAYTRVSTPRQAEPDKFSLERQREIVNAVAALNGLVIDEIFCDPGESGDIPIAQRTEGRRMIEMLRAGDALIIPRLDRAFRSATDAMVTSERLKKMKVDLYLADMGTQPVTRNGLSQMFFGMLALVAEFDKFSRLEGLAAGKRSKQSKGGFIGGQAPYGKRVVGVGRSAQLEDDPAEVAVIERIAAFRAEGLSFRRIAAVFANDGTLNRSGGSFDQQQIHRIVKRLEGEAK